MSKTVTKVWGSEKWLHNDQKYCMKILELNPGYQSSLHFHKLKTETFLVVAGTVRLEVIKGYRVGMDSREVKILKPLDYYTLNPFTPHRFSTLDGPATIIEASTKHSDEDVYRLEQSRTIG